MSDNLPEVIDAEIVPDEDESLAGFGVLSPEYLPETTAGRRFGRQPSYTPDPGYGWTDYLKTLRNNYLDAAKRRAEQVPSSQTSKKQKKLLKKYAKDLTQSTSGGELTKKQRRDLAERQQALKEAAEGNADSMREVTSDVLDEAQQDLEQKTERATNLLAQRADALADAATTPPAPPEGGDQPSSGGDGSSPPPLEHTIDSKKKANSDRLREAIRHPLGAQERLRMLSLSPYDIMKAYGCSEAEECRAIADFTLLDAKTVGIVHLPSERSDENKLKIFKSISSAAVTKLSKPAIEAIDEHLTNYQIGAL